MKPVVTPLEMQAIDASATEPVEVLIERAGYAVAMAIITRLRQQQRRIAGTRVLCLAGPGNNGADGRVAAAVLRRFGAYCQVIDLRTAESAPARLHADVVIDAAVGTGLGRPFSPPSWLTSSDDTLVVAVDIPSGIDGESGVRRTDALRADLTVTFGALKPGLLLADGPDYAGDIVVAPIGLDCSDAAMHLTEATDVARWPSRPRTAHKWQAAVWIIGGAPTMMGAPHLSALGALRAGAGYAVVSVPGAEPGLSNTVAATLVPERVERPVGYGWAHDIAAEVDRIGALVIGPGLPPSAVNLGAVRLVAAEHPSVPVVLDAGALDAIGERDAGPVENDGKRWKTDGRAHQRFDSQDHHWLSGRSMPAVLTPHEGEFRRMLHRMGVDAPLTETNRIELLRLVARRLGAVVLLKGAPTVIAEPAGQIRISAAGDSRLATAGTGDVLAGVIGAGLAMGLAPMEAASLGAELHGRAARHGQPVGLVARDLGDLISQYLSVVKGGA